jgi:metal-dependent amidase/aminoacylase/carboxypeptidase family protein
MMFTAFAEFVSKNRHLFRGRILALFQPAEEIAQGAQKMLSDPKFAALGHVDYAFV